MSYTGPTTRDRGRFDTSFRGSAYSRAMEPSLENSAGQRGLEPAVAAPAAPVTSAAAREPGVTLALLSLLCGVVSIPLSLLVIGLIFGLVGLVFGLTQIFTARKGRVLSWIGAGASALGCALSLGMLAVILITLRHGVASMNTVESFDGWVGAEALDFVAADTSGNYIQLSSFRGKRVILDFRGAQCAACDKEEGFYAALREAHSPDDVAIIGVGAGAVDALKKSVEERRLSYPVVAARDLPSPYSDIPITPTAIFIDRSGHIHKILMGLSSLEELQGNLKAME